MEARQRPEAIAHISLADIVFFNCLGFCAAIALIIYMLVLEFRDHRFSEADGLFNSHPGFAHGAYLLLFVILIGGLSAFLPAMIRTVRGIAAGRGVALWIENGHLVYADRKAFELPLADIEAVWIKTLSLGAGLPFPIRSDCIAFRLKDGREKSLTANFSENRQAIVANLRQRVGLPAGDFKSS